MNGGEINQKFVACPSCGVQNPEGSHFCQGCGQDLQLATQTAPLAQEEVIEAGAAPEQDQSLALVAYCPSCGMQNPADSRFCQACGVAFEADLPLRTDSQAPAPSGSQLQVPASEASGNPLSALPKDTGHRQEKKSKKKRLFIVVGASVLLLLAVVVLVLRLASASSYPYGEAKHAFRTYYDKDADRTAVVVDSKLIGMVDGRAELTQIDARGSSALCQSAAGELYYFTARELQNIANECDGSAELAADGTALTYVEDDVLYLYKVSARTKTRLAEGLSYTGHILSPDGRAVGYFKEDEDDSKSFNGYIYLDGKTITLGKNIAPLAISNHGKTAFCVRYNASSNTGALGLFRTKQEEFEKIHSFDKLESYSSSFLLFNIHNSEILFSEEDQLYYADNKGKKEKISGLAALDKYWNLFSYDSLRHGWQGFHENSRSASLLHASYLDAKGSLYYVDGQVESSKIASEVRQPERTRDGRTVFYLKSEKLYRRLLGKNEEAERLAVEVRAFKVSDDGNHVYYINNDDELWYIYKKQEAKKIADDLYEIQATYKDTVYFLSDYDRKTATLYAAKHGQAKKKIADDVITCYASANTVYYQVDAGEGLYDVYASTHAESFKKIISDFKFN